MLQKLFGIKTEKEPSPANLRAKRDSEKYRAIWNDEAKEQAKRDAAAAKRTRDANAAKKAKARRERRRNRGRRN